MDRSPSRREGLVALLRRHRIAFIVTASVVLVLGTTTSVFAYLWTHSGSRPVSSESAYARYRPGPVPPSPATFRPTQGVYSYRGSGTEHVSLPAKTQLEGPEIPGTVTNLANGCWRFRLDFSDNHWQSWTYCPRGGALLLEARAGYYRWDFVAFAVDNTATYACSPPEVVIPADSNTTGNTAVSCRGTNDHLALGTIVMTGSNRFVSKQTLTVGRSQVTALHYRERVALSGGQQGFNDADTWFSASNGLPLRGTWRTEVKTPSPVGTTTLTASGSFYLSSLVPRS